MTNRALDSIIKEELRDLGYNMGCLGLYDERSARRSLYNMQKLIECMYTKIESLEEEVKKLKSKDCSSNPKYF